VWLIIAATFISILRSHDGRNHGRAGKILRKPSPLGDAFLCWWRIQMRTLITTLVFLMLGSAAMAQNTGTGSSSSTTTKPTREAPVGHRQPRADQVPSEKNLSNPNDPANREDAALDRKIKSICRGC
jgi:hypothetical protein